MKSPSEGDDYLEYAAAHEHERPIRIIKFGDGFVSCDDANAIGISASGPDALKTLAMRLFTSGFDPHRKLVLYRAGQCIGKTTIGQAAGIEGVCNVR